MASRNLGFFFGSQRGHPECVEQHLQRLEGSRAAAPGVFGRPGGAGRDGFEWWDNPLGPTEAFTTWRGDLESEDVTDTLRLAISLRSGRRAAR